MSTLEQYNQFFDTSAEIFQKKTVDYGTSWRIFLLSSITDQIYIKAKRIKTLLTVKENKVGDSIESELYAIINYGIIALIQQELINSSLDHPIDIPAPICLDLYKSQRELITEVMLLKNHDYGEAWREMRVTSIVDLILVKLHRLKQIEDNSGETLISEGVENNYIDIINYAVFLLIKL